MNKKDQERLKVFDLKFSKQKPIISRNDKTKTEK